MDFFLFGKSIQRADNGSVNQIADGIGQVVAAAEGFCRDVKAVKQGNEGAVFVFILLFGLKVQPDFVPFAVSPDKHVRPGSVKQRLPPVNQVKSVRLSRLRKVLGKGAS